MNIRMLRSDGVSTIPVLPQQKILRITLPVICSIAATLVGCGPLPNQSTLPPTVRITYCTGNPCGPFQSGNGRVDPNQPLTVFVDGFSFAERNAEFRSRSRLFVLVQQRERCSEWPGGHDPN